MAFKTKSKEKNKGDKKILDKIMLKAKWMSMQEWIKVIPQSPKYTIFMVL
jgi:hypothetical protein